MSDLFAVQYSWLIPLLPLLGAAVAGFFGARWLKGQSHWPIWIGAGASAVLSIVLLVQMIGHSASSHHQASHGQTEAQAVSVQAGEWEKAFEHSAGRTIYTWIGAGGFSASVGFFLDPLTAVMLCVVTGISFLITVFSKGYMRGEAGYFRFFAFMGIFVFMMTILVMADNFVLLYLGWEGVGLSSYLLIGYYYEKPAAREAAKKAFLVNRVGDFGFALGIMLIFVTFGTVSFFGTSDAPGALVQATQASSPLSAMSPAMQTGVLWIPFLLMLGAFGKSAQFPLYVWLPDAMEGPTPVSALIHAATMVTAGVYMIVRCSTLFFLNGYAMITIAIIGAFTAIFAASIALRQYDLKKVFAYSTISQLGFMFVGAAVLAPVAAVFHLVTHAFFKALLFLSSGVVMHAMAGELDMRKMSGVRRVLPWTNWFILAGCFALAGMIPFSGFWSKDEIVIASFDRIRGHVTGPVLGIIMLFTALMTAYYTFRLYFRVFQGPTLVPPAPDSSHGHAHDHSHSHEPASMMIPLGILAIGAVLAGFLNTPWWHGLGNFLGGSPSFALVYKAMGGDGNLALNPLMFGQHPPADMPAESHTNLMVASILIALLGILLAYLMHLKERSRAERLAARFPGIVHVLERKYWVDEIYQYGLVEPLRRLGRAFFAVDRMVIDGLIWTVSFIPQVFGFGLKLTTQRGSLQGYAVTMVLAIALVLLVIFVF